MAHQTYYTIPPFSADNDDSEDDYFQKGAEDTGAAAVQLMGTPEVVIELPQRSNDAQPGMGKRGYHTSWLYFLPCAHFTPPNQRAIRHLIDSLVRLLVVAQSVEFPDRPASNSHQHSQSGAKFLFSPPSPPLPILQWGCLNSRRLIAY